MSWTRRQHALLREIGVPLWPGAGGVPAETVVAAVPMAPVAAPVSPPAPVTARVESAPPAMAAAAVEPVSAPEPAPAGRAVPLLPARRAAAPAGLTPHPQAAEIASMSWDALREAVSGCRACPLCESRRQTVFGAGHPQAHWMLVGEAPGEQEDLRGEPFVGKAGQLLDNMLRAVGLGRGEASPEQQVCIANVLKCRPPGNRNPGPEEVLRCEPFLMRQVELVRPKLILAMGRFAVQSLLGSTEPIGRLRGRMHEYHGVPLVVTYHPAYLLRNPLDKARSWEDLCLAGEVYRQAMAAG
ncbi:DNA polymerase [Sphaerotilus hippei]|uniref:Type-4 uracil-DNA glycosylase n=1 Tax=Sphaerotilus hippei TaxID=744406 RepID=A0A318H045_9BURK|nr:uracil-DNA glycosylase [Sphaerotilus hippei]PXW95872.1 DNA polymerase [Sphaerotilus hippei]